MTYSAAPTTSYTDTSILRAFRADEFRDLVRLALRQGWDVYPERGGHVAAVSPTGRTVRVSVTAYAAHGVLVAKRREFIAAGLDLRSKAERRRAHRQEVRMEVPQANGAAQAQARPLPAGGKFARIGEVEVQDVKGRQVRLWGRVDGQWVAEVRDPSLAGRRRSWYGPGREELLAKVRDTIDTPPILRGPRNATQERATADLLADAAEDAALADSRTRLEDVHLPEPEPPEVLTTLVAAADQPGAWHVVSATPEEYPLAAALDHLDERVRPALEALAQAGKSDAVALLEGELVRTPVEEELLALYRRVMTGA